MKKFLIFLTLVNITPCMAAVHLAGGAGDGLDSLRNEIKKLEQQLAKKSETLNKCAEKNKNFQIAGIATVSLAGAGVATNVSLYSKMKDQQKQAQNMVNKIKNANTRVENWGNDLLKKASKCSAEKLGANLEKSLTDAEMQRFLEMHDKDFDIETEYNGNIDNMPETDKIIIQKMFRAVENCE